MPDPAPADPSQPSLRRVLTLTTATAIVIGSVIGSGIFKKTAGMTEALPSPLLVLAVWLAAGGVTFLGALSSAELAAAWPESGGLYAHLRRVLGRFTGFLYGWSVLSVIQTGSIASIAYIFAEYLRHFGGWGDVAPPGLQAWGVTLFGTIDLYPFRDLGTKLVAVACITVVTALNVAGVRLGARVQDVFMGLKLLIMVAIVAVALAAGDFARLLAGDVLPASVVPPALGGTASWAVLAGALTVAVSGAFWAYDGWINVTYVAAEMRRPDRDTPRALALGLALTVLCYVGVNAAYFALLPVDAIRGSSLVASDAVGAVLAAGADLVALAVVVSTFGALNGTALSSARVYFAMARDGLFFRRIGHVHPRRETPDAALILQWFWSSALVFSGTFDQITDMLIFVSWGFYGLLAVAVIVARFRFPEVPRPYRVPGYPWVPAVFIAFSAVYVVLSVVENTRNAALGTLLVALGLPFWLWFGRRGRAA